MRTAISACLCAVLAGCSLPTDEKLLQAQDMIRSQLIDPGSAQFRNVQGRGDAAVCGEVNSKNRFGGYVGFRRFVVDRQTNQAVLDPQEYLTSEAREMFPGLAGGIMDTAAFDQMYRRLCP